MQYLFCTLMRPEMSVEAAQIQQIFTVHPMSTVDGNHTPRHFGVTINASPR